MTRYNHKSKNDPILDIAAIVAECGPISEEDVKVELRELGWHPDDEHTSMMFKAAKIAYVREIDGKLVAR